MTFSTHLFPKTTYFRNSISRHARCSRMSALFSPSMHHFMASLQMTYRIKIEGLSNQWSSEHRHYTTAAAESESTPSDVPLQHANDPMAPRTRRRLVPQREILSFTPSALKRIKFLLSRKKGAIGLKVGIRKRGCNGLSYTLDYVMEEPAPGTHDVVEKEGVRVYVDQTALFYVIGTEMNYIENEVEAKFEWKNPKAKSLCGCGESFTV